MARGLLTGLEGGVADVALALSAFEGTCKYIVVQCNDDARQSLTQCTTIKYDALQAVQHSVVQNRYTVQNGAVLYNSTRQKKGTRLCKCSPMHSTTVGCFYHSLQYSTIEHTAPYIIQYSGMQWLTTQWVATWCSTTVVQLADVTYHIQCKLGCGSHLRRWTVTCLQVSPMSQFIIVRNNVFLQ